MKIAIRKDSDIRADYERARDAYAAFGVDADLAVEHLGAVPLSLHCWQGDDVRGFEAHEGVDGGGIMATGGRPGAARDAGELRDDMDAALALVPGPMRANLHAIYAETGGAKVGRDELGPEHFANWIAWAKERGLGLDFNPTFFAHPLAGPGGTLSSADPAVRRFWVEHGKASRRIASAMGAATGSPAVNNVWIPDGAKDSPADRWSPRQRLAEALDEVFAETLPGNTVADSVEGKLFGLGSEDYVVGSHEFYLAYCVSRGKVPCLDMGHYHPTESVADKVSAVLAFVDRALIHASRGVRWDSDHVVILNDDLFALFAEIVRGGALDRVFLALDFFDASINRVAAWAIGARSAKTALLSALLEPTETLRQMEAEGEGAGKLAFMQQLRLLPLGAVWDWFCLKHGTPGGLAWLGEAQRYEEEKRVERG